jgi:ethanolamine permease
VKKHLELIFYVSFCAGMAFGSSSFTMISGLFEAVTSTWVIVSVCLAGTLCVLISGSVAELASMYPSSPGIRTYLKVAFDSRVSLVLVYLYLIFMVLIAGVESYMFALVVEAISPSLSAVPVVLGLIAFAMTVNLLGLELPRGLQILTTWALLLCLVALSVYGAVQTPAPGAGFAASAASPEAGGTLSQLKMLPAVTTMAIFLFTGFEWVTLLGFSPRSYERRIPVSMPLGIIALILTYSIFVVGLSSQVSRQGIVATPVPQVPYLTQLFGGPGAYVAGGLSLLAIFSTFNAGIMGGSRLIYVLTREGNLPKWCAKMSLRTGAPVGGIISLGTLTAVSSLLIIVYKQELLAAVVGSTIVSFVYAAFMLAAIKLRKKLPRARRSFRTPLPEWLQWPLVVVIPAMGVVSLFSQVNMRYWPVVWLVVLTLVAAGLARWSLLRVSNAALEREKAAADGA